MSILPSLKIFDSKNFMLRKCKRFLIISEGFEERSLEWIKSLPLTKIFENCFVFKNVPERKSRFEELIPEIQKRTYQQEKELDYDRRDPIKSEYEMIETLSNKLEKADEIFIDVSVMSKLLITIIIFLLRSFNGNVRFIYSEPENYIPSEEDYNKFKEGMASMVSFPTFGVHDVVRTPLLTSTTMQNSPSILVTFTSFNEQLIRALLSNISPSHLFLINGTPPHLKWRAKATQEIHKDIIQEYAQDNPMDGDNLHRQASTLDYRETFDILTGIYKKYCYTNRIILSPTGSKMQAVGAAFFKICCPDVHIEYPTPESFFIEGFSSTKIRNVHELYIERFQSFLEGVADRQGLNG